MAGDGGDEPRGDRAQAAQAAPSGEGDGASRQGDQEEARQQASGGFVDSPAVDVCVFGERSCPTLVAFSQVMLLIFRSFQVSQTELAAVLF